MEREKYTRRMSDSIFIKGLLASLVHQGQTSIGVCNNEHQIRLRYVVSELEAITATDTTLKDRFPRLIPSPFTGRFAVFDQVLLSAQESGITSSSGPYFEKMELTVSPERAERILEKFSRTERGLLSTLGEVFIQTPTEP